MIRYRYPYPVLKFHTISIPTIQWQLDIVMKTLKIKQSFYYYIDIFNFIVILWKINTWWQIIIRNQLTFYTWTLNAIGTRYNRSIREHFNIKHLLRVGYKKTTTFLKYTLYFCHTQKFMISVFRFKMFTIERPL